MATEQRYLITVGGHDYVLSKHEQGLSQVLVLTVDGEEMARAKSSDKRVTLGDDDRPDLGHLTIRLTTLGSVRRATLTRGDLDVDLDPEPGSKAARLEAKAREHPRLYAARHVVGAVAGLLVPLLGLGLLVKLLLGWLTDRLPDVNLPSIDLPSLPLPDWDLPDWELPGWVTAAVAVAKYVVPVAIAIGIAAHEVRRRRQQDQLKEQLREGAVAAEPSGRRTGGPNTE
ncbi:hypothetical protein [Luteipulveratus mongoliensis]|uniref:hypothetical protein n=1 Tax=Luteipulveratus mongoliensis TaxID=571913 RepID=UPI0012ED4033|nr:hypothetical protein [Luteipulveratus mongoliensis]